MPRGDDTNVGQKPDGTETELKLDALDNLKVTLAEAAAITPVNVEELDGNPIDLDRGNVGAGTQRVAIADDDTNMSAIKTAIELLDDLQGALKSVDTDELITRITDSAGTEINPAKEDGNLNSINTAVEIMDDWDESDRAMVNPVVGQAGVAADTGVIDASTQRMTIATDDTVATDLTDILAALLLRMPSDGVTHRSPQHLSATYMSSNTLTVTGGPTIVDNSQIVKIVQIKADNTSAEWKQGQNCTLTHAGGVIQIHGVAPFVIGDKYAVCLSIGEWALDITQDVKKIIEQAPDWDHFVGPEDLISSAQVLTTAFADLGNEISMKTFNQLGFFPTIDINDASDIEFRFLHKVESGGAEEYREITLGSPVAGITTINLNDYQIGDDNDQLFKLNIPTANTTHYMQVQARMKTDGGVDAQITACVITKAWSRS